MIYKLEKQLKDCAKKKELIEQEIEEIKTEIKKIEELKNNDNASECSTCGGTGYCMEYNGVETIKVKCMLCHGRGLIAPHICYCGEIIAVEMKALRLKIAPQCPYCGRNLAELRY